MNVNRLHGEINGTEFPGDVRCQVLQGIKENLGNSSSISDEDKKMIDEAEYKKMIEDAEYKKNLKDAIDKLLKLYGCTFDNL